MSYSWKDMTVATRLYDDLTRSKIHVWRDQIDGEPTSDFLEEFLSKIDECDDFIILDSKNYRNKSNWCLTEIERCFYNREKRNAPRIIVCLLDKDGEWRWQFKNEKFKMLFSKLNMFKYIELYYDGTYDNASIYQQSIRKLCNLFEERYIPWDNLPESRDFIEELVSNQTVLQNEDKELLISEYKNIVRLTDLHRNVNSHFKLWIEDCKYFNISAFFPRWSYCLWLGKNEHAGFYDDDCHENFIQLINDFPNDPRGYRGLGSILARIGNYKGAELQLKRSLDLMSLEENLHHKNYAEYEVKSNLAQVLMNQEKFIDAIPLLKDCFEHSIKVNIKDISIVSNYNYCLLYAEKYDDSLQMLKQCRTVYELEGAYQKKLGFTYTALLENQLASNCFYKSYILHPSPETAYLYLCRQMVLGKDIDHNFVTQVLNNDIVLDEDNYWKGAICYFLLDDVRMAKEYYDLCECEFEWYENN